MSDSRRPYPSGLSDAEWELLAPPLAPDRSMWPTAQVADTPRRRVVEPGALGAGFARLGQARHLPEGYERLPAVADEMIDAAMSRIMLHRLPCTALNTAA